MGYAFSTPVQSYNVLIADPDRKLANVIRSMLKEMDFDHVEITHSGARARELLKEQPFDVLITEWDIADIDGITLINHIRNDPDSPNPRLPIIMLTDRTDRADVATARDTGINEFVVKPFSAKVLFDHLEHLIEKRKAADADAAEAAARQANAANAADKGSMVFNPALLNSAQASIDAITAESLQWIKEDLAKMKSLHQKMVAGETGGGLLSELSEVAQDINTHAGKSGYSRAAEIADNLRRFFSGKIQPGNALHHVVVQKHIEVLQVIFGNNIVGTGGNAGEAISAELYNLTRKYASQ